MIGCDELIYSYGFSIKGKAHEKRDVVCQDSNCIKVLDDNICIAAVADGLGSESCSDIASHIACNTAVEFCANNIEFGMSNKRVLSIVKRSFKKALNQIEKRVEKENGDILQYDTTLSLCVLICGRLYYGHSGDSGIIALSDNGYFHKITEQQRDNEGRVYPLAFGEEYWKFGCFKGRVAGVLLATDGVLELFYPIYLRFSEVNMYTSLARYFLGINHICQDDFDINLFGDSRRNYVLNIPESISDDDKTIVAIIDDNVDVHWQDEEYYKEPDWNLLKEKYKDDYNRKAYLGDNP